MEFAVVAAQGKKLPVGAALDDASFVQDDDFVGVPDGAQPVGDGSIPETVKLMKQIVPEYISNNSKFEEFDKK